MKNKKYTDHLGVDILSKFAPIIFDITGAIGPETKALLDTKFKKFPTIYNSIVDSSKYFKCKEWLYKRISFCTAKSNYSIYDAYVKANGSKYL